MDLPGPRDSGVQLGVRFYGFTPSEVVSVIRGTRDRSTAPVPASVIGQGSVAACVRRRVRP